MLHEFQKSIKAVLYDKLTSPLTGTFFFSWFAWNWRLVYYVILGDNTRNIIERMEYIEGYFLDFHYIVSRPVISTAVLIIIYPFITTFAYWVTLKFRKWKKEIKNEIEDETPLSVKESRKIKELIRDEIENRKEQDGKFQVLIEDFNTEIEKLKKENSRLKQVIETKDGLEKLKNDEQLKLKLGNKIYKDKKIGTEKISSVVDKELNGKNYKEIKTYSGQTFLLSKEDLEKQIKE
ncbi:hypothetical protein KAI52_00835 [Candidatus Parcubacteria bacterium]|nr:hypothetical protein [Candidatus Parcubacteria bacterium]